MGEGTQGQKSDFLKLKSIFVYFLLTGSGRKYLQTSKFNPAYQELSIEVHNVAVVQVEVDFLSFLILILLLGDHKKLRGSPRFQFESNLYKIGIFLNY